MQTAVSLTKDFLHIRISFLCNKDVQKNQRILDIVKTFRQYSFIFHFFRCYMLLTAKWLWLFLTKRFHMKTSCPSLSFLKFRHKLKCYWTYNISLFYLMSRYTFHHVACNRCNLSITSHEMQCLLTFLCNALNALVDFF